MRVSFYLTFKPTQAQALQSGVLDEEECRGAVGDAVT